ncbi:hypothetical protein CJ030_MR7G017472 [Morella rubra]|uniref:Uncharacterized protein n=1 Tax=Morella rubra TaxID=262757 RepID=A0A6A1V4S6_9ROSI|nr:hypothetical protein CJ030_MR7G017472 [Morella rubra]
MTEVNTMNSKALETVPFCKSEPFHALETPRVLSKTPCVYGPYWGTHFAITSVSAPNHLKVLNPVTQCSVLTGVPASFSLRGVNDKETGPQEETPLVLDGIDAVVGQHVLFGGVSDKKGYRLNTR